jgi:hypothetical protein
MIKPPAAPAQADSFSPGVFVCVFVDLYSVCIPVSNSQSLFNRLNICDIHRLLAVFMLTFAASPTYELYHPCCVWGCSALTCRVQDQADLNAAKNLLVHDGPSDESFSANTNVCVVKSDIEGGW